MQSGFYVTWTCKARRCYKRDRPSTLNRGQAMVHQSVIRWIHSPLECMSTDGPGLSQRPCWSCMKQVSWGGG